ncbi:acetyl-CoA acetyltransferase [Alteriqipengyuania flavescens]|uniref:acetyl-CoA acetyltransferase n=1 Tax=Alteriqipengyuania flavescens TaxID=3053610 RepID=UPI0025B4039B|nr:acetyl-CoA acetyltransferase [Alteriqipengyuania flavescens]WJY17819.1 acetyl-CoA acetyltransferase [Alteriqipengyuania flavescens]WJY23761.1 acetyl-CoA acetyltransferase [Alteriqipengyuania flavescens]
MTIDPERIPVIVGVGQVNDRPERAGDGLDSGGLMVEALRRADADAGGGWLAAADHLAVIGQISGPQLNPLDRTVAGALGMSAANTEQTPPHGETPVRLLNEAANRIGAGEARICAVTGGEALRTAGQLAKARAAKDAPKKDALRDAPHRKHTGYAQSHGLVVPVDVYPLYENACRAAWGQSLADAQHESGTIWSHMSEVAAANPAAWMRTPFGPQEIVAPDADNRPIAFPYTKLQVANAAVNMGAGFIVASLAEARRRGLDEARLVHVGHGAGAHEPTDILARANYHASPGMAAVLEETLARGDLATDAIDHVELYSCFPCVPKMARRIIGWPAERPATVFGGLTFGGGPIGNYMSHAIAAMVYTLRGTGETGLLFGNGGYATHNHAIVLSGRATGAAFPQGFDVQAKADAARGAVPPLDETYTGAATLETFTVHYARDGSARLGTVVALTPDGARTLAIVPADDGATIAALTDGRTEPVGRPGRISREGGALSQWHFA